ncbi:MAG: hypothetical protein FJZ62_05260 [Chlamydiae bacterium]|nr:hypothetical protein [Chlamydiota bacterium]
MESLYYEDQPYLVKVKAQVYPHLKVLEVVAEKFEKRGEELQSEAVYSINSLRDASSISSPKSMPPPGRSYNPLKGPLSCGTRRIYFSLKTSPYAPIRDIFFSMWKSFFSVDVY